MNPDFYGRGWLLPREKTAVSTTQHGRLINLTTPQTEIRQSIAIILMTSPGERVMRPNFGCRIHELCFAPANRETAVLAEQYVTEALNRWEPRIRLEKVTATPEIQQSEGALLINIAYTIRTTDEIQQVTFPLYLSSA